MKLFIPSLMLTGSIALAGAPAAPQAISGQHILDAVVARLPQHSMTVNGDIVVRKRRGVVLQELRFEVALDWGSHPAKAQYTIMDSFGSELERFTVRHDAVSGTRIEHSSQHDELSSDAVSLHSQIQQTDMTWADLTLSFLWWPDSSIVDHDSVRGRACIVVDVPSPPLDDSGVAASPGPAAASYASTRLWIDRELLMLIQALGLDKDGDPIRKLWVDSLKKIDGQWMIKDLEVQSYPPKQRTRVRVREISVAAPS